MIRNIIVEKPQHRLESGNKTLSIMIWVRKLFVKPHNIDFDLVIGDILLEKEQLFPLIPFPLRTNLQQTTLIISRQRNGK